MTTTTSTKQARTEPITVNSDMGEGIGLLAFGNDEELLRIIDSANVACGFHAGDPAIMDKTVALAAENGVKVGSHPALPDITGFGRRRMAVTPKEVEQLVAYQTGALSGFCLRHGVELDHIKPHGALYGMAAEDEALALAVAKVAELYGVSVYGMAGTGHQTACDKLGVPFVGELYVDMNYGPSGELLIGRHPEPTKPEAAADRVRRALAGDPITADDGSEIFIAFDSVCVHSDGPTALEVARAVREAVDQA